MRKPSAIATALATAALLWAAVPDDALAGGRHRGGQGHDCRDRPQHYGRSETWIHVTQVRVRPAPPPWTGHHRPHHGCDDHSWRNRGGWRPHRPASAVTYASGYSSGGRELIGTLVGGAVGGVMGSTIGKGSGRTAAIVGGTVLGVLVGGSVGRSMDEVDRLYVDHALETVPNRDSLAWQNPDTRAAYEVTPLATYQDGGRYCREYTATAWVAGKEQQIYGTACRQPDGSWEVVR